MPEGDTIFRAARTLHEALAGRAVTRFETVLPHLARVDDQEPLAGRTIERVVAAGKHLIIDFSGGLHLRTHMRMNGSWHIYRPHDRWQRRRSDMRLLIETAEWIAVGFNIPVAEFLNDAGALRQEDLRRIGPDILAEDFDLDEALRRIRARPDAEIGEVLLHQRVVAGIGNIWKSESLFAARLNPFAHVSALTEDELRNVLDAARRQMRHSVGRDTRPRYWIYGRAGKPCRRCGTAIAYAKQGADVRGTYWCPRCQVPDP